MSLRNEQLLLLDMLTYYYDLSDKDFDKDRRYELIIKENKYT